MTTDIERAAALLADAGHVAISSGAGISKESGVPTFRDAQEGLWAKYDPQELATPQAFRDHPDRVWAWYMYRHNLVSDVEPNPGHYAVADLEDLFPQVTVITQNVDGLHIEAGSSDIIHLHGSLKRFKCADNCQGHPTLIDLDEIDYDEEHAPPCPHCDNGLVRPDVVWFGEMLPPGALERAKQVSAACDVMIIVGTSGLVQPAASLPGLAKNAGAALIEVNLDRSMLTRLADVKLSGPSGEMLPQLVQAIRSHRNE